MSGDALYWVGIAFGFGAVVVYFGALAMRPRWVRLLHGSGLFFTGLALIQAGVLLRHVHLGAAWFNANVLIVALSIAAVVQSYSALRNRRAWDGVDRRSEPQA